MDNLKSTVFLYCGITSVHPDALANLTNLVELDLSDNKLTQEKLPSTNDLIWIVLPDKIRSGINQTPIQKKEIWTLGQITGIINNNNNKQQYKNNTKYNTN